MNKQRLIILISAAIGILAAFMPWRTAVIFGVTVSNSGVNLGPGIFSLLAFIGILVIVLLGDRASTVSKKAKWVIFALSVAIDIAVVMSFNSFSSFGAYLTFLVTIPIDIVIFRNPKPEA